MESKKINQLATEMAPATSDLTIIGDPITGVSKKITLLQIADLFATTGTVTSVAVTETGDALTITGSPITSAGTINIGFAGDATQYVRGDGALADFPTSTGGGSSVSYYLNSSVSQGTIGGVAYRELSKDPISGAGTDITISANGYIASYITDANDPALLEVPGGNFNCEFYFSVNSNNHNPSFYAELYKYDGSTFTLLGSSQSVPEYLSNGTTLSPYYFAIPVATAVLSVTDRLAIRIYVNVDGRVVTLHTENNHLCQVVTTFSKGLTSLNNLTRQVQFLATGTSGTDFNISSTTATHTFNIPDASASNRGLITTGTQTIAGSKAFDNAITGNAGIAFLNGVMPPITSSYYSGIGGNSQGISIVTRPVSTNYTNNLYFPSASNSYTFPNATGTLALTSDLTAYVTLATTQTITGDKTYSGVNTFDTYQTRFNAGIAINQTLSGGAVSSHTVIGANVNGLNVNFPAGGYNSLNFASTSAGNTYTFPNATGTIALTSQLTGGTVTSVGLSSATSGVTIGSSPITTSGTITLTIATASGSLNGLLSSTDWTTFNGKQDALNGTGFVKISGTTISYDNSTYLTTSAAASTYLPLTGGTLSGVLNGTSATFSGNMAIGSSTAALSPLQVVATGTIVRLGEQSGTTGKQFLIGIDATSGRSELQSVWQGTGFTSLALQPSGGNVLIGTTTDNGAKLQVSGTATFSSSIAVGGAGMGLTGINLPNQNYLAWYVSGGSGSQNVAIRGNGDNLELSSGGGLTMTMDASQRVGIGTSSPYANLDLGASGANNIILRNLSNAYNLGYIGNSGGRMDIGFSNSNGSLSPLPYLSITSGGNVLVGNTTDRGYRFQANSNSGTYAMEIRQNVSTASSIALSVTHEATSGTRNMIFFYSGGYGESGSITSGNTTTSYNTSSDYRLKQDLKDYSGLNLISAIKTYDFEWEADNSRMYGVMAHELAEVIPYAVVGEKDGIDENGKIIKQGVDYSKLVPILVKAIQEQQAQIEELKQLILNK